MTQTMVYLIEKADEIAGACIQGLTSDSYMFVTVSEAETLTDTVADRDWRDLEVIDYRNVEMEPARTTPDMRKLLAT